MIEIFMVTKLSQILPMKVTNEWKFFFKQLFGYFEPRSFAAQLFVAPKTDKERDFCAIPFSYNSQESLHGK